MVRIGPSAWFSSRYTSRAWLVVLLLVSAPAVARGESLTIRFSGTADLSVFGGAAASVFHRSVTWDPDSDWFSEQGCPDFCLDGTPGAVTGTLAIDAVDVTSRISPISRFVVWGFGGISLDLVLDPPLDLDAGPAPDVLLFSLNLHSDPPDYTLLVDNELPPNLLCLPRLTVRSAFFSDTIAGVSACVDVLPACADADTLLVTPEPTSAALLLLGLSVAGSRLRRRG